MFEKRIAKSTLRFIGVEQPSREDIARFVTKFKIDKMKTTKKIMVGLAMPTLLSLVEYRLFGVYENEDGQNKKEI